MGKTMDKILPFHLMKALWFPVFFVIAFSACYVGGFHSPTPHQLPTAIVGPAATTGPLIGQLEASAGDSLDLRAETSLVHARQELANQEIVGVYVPAGTDSQLLVSGAGGVLVEKTIEDIFGQVAAQEVHSASPVTVTDINPLSSDDRLGNTFLYITLAVIICGYITTIVLLQAAPHGPLRHMIAAMVLTAAIGAAAVQIVAGPIFGAVHGHVPELSLLFFMTSLTCSLLVYGAAPFLKQYVLGFALLVFVFLGLPASGAAYPVAFMPHFFRDLHPILPTSRAIDAARQIIYFDGQNMPADLRVVAAWLAGAVGLILLARYKHRPEERLLLEDAEEEALSMAVAHA